MRVPSAPASVPVLLVSVALALSEGHVLLCRLASVRTRRVAKHQGAAIASKRSARTNVARSAALASDTAQYSTPPATPWSAW
jgi:hypothetical protein